MKIYKLAINSIADDPDVCISSYRAPRTTKVVEYYASKEKAEAKKNEIYDGVYKLAGFIPKMEVIISEVEVIE
jgi:hypothetical protein